LSTPKELRLERAGRLRWHEQAPVALQGPGDAIVRPFVAGRCDGDALPIHRRVSRALQAGMRMGVVDPVVGCICGRVPFQGPFAIGHECVAEVLETGADVRHLRRGDHVVVPWAVSCGACENCRRGLTSKCTTTTDRELAAFGFGAASGTWGGMVCDRLRIPHADHLLVPVPAGVPALRVAAASDNLSDAWRAVVHPLRERSGGSVLVIGGGARSIGLYAAGLAARHGASTVVYADADRERRGIAERLGAATSAEIPARTGGFDVVVEASSRADGLRRGLRALAPGGIVTAVGYYLATGTKVPLMRMYATDATLRLGVSHARALIPEVLEFVAASGFPAEDVTTVLGDWDDAPTAYAARTTKVVLHRTPLTTAPSAPPAPAR